MMTEPARFCPPPEPCCRDVLVVEDDAAVLRLFRRVLEQAGYQVSATESGTQAANLLVEKPFCAVVSDIAIPGMTGIDLLRCVRVHDLDAPVILVTGATDVRTAADAIGHGAFQLLMKPVPPALLVGEVRRAERLFARSATQRQAMRLLEAEEVDLKESRHLLGRALASIWMAYQPIVDREGKIYGYESLLRSGEPALPTTAKVLELAERLGAMSELGSVVRTKSCEGFAHAPAGAHLFVNLHASDLVDERLFRPDSPLASIADRVVLEITERASLDEIGDVRDRIDRLRAMGYRIAIDDLGSGYSGLASFTTLEPELVKIDMSLVRDIHRSTIKSKLTRLIVATCKEVGSKVVAEGIETVEERDTLLELGCDLFQGYFIAKPAFPLPVPRW